MHCKWFSIYTQFVKKKKKKNLYTKKSLNKIFGQMFIAQVWVSFTGPPHMVSEMSFSLVLWGSDILLIVTSRQDRLPQVSPENPQLVSPLTTCEEVETEAQREEEWREPDGRPLISLLLTRPGRETRRTQRSTSLWFGSLENLQVYSSMRVLE